MEGYRIPDFSVSQIANHIYVTVSCSPASTTSSPSIAVEDRIFGFHLDSFYLPLVLPHAVRQSTVQSLSLGSSNAQRFQVILEKVQPGQDFAGLDQLQPQILPDDQLKQAVADAEHGKGLFEAKADSTSTSTDEAAKALLQQTLLKQGLTSMNDDDGEADLVPEPPTSRGTAATKDTASPSQSTYGFGFGSRFRGSLIPSGSTDVRNVIEVQDPGSVPPDQRERKAEAFEEERWDEGVYMENFLDQEGEIEHILKYALQFPSSSSVTEPARTKVSQEAAMEVEMLCLLVQVLFAFSYDERTNEGDPTIESGWTIAKLCRAMSASVVIATDGTSLEPSLVATLRSCIRRALTVPLYRHWQLALQCLTDCVERLRAGKPHILYCLQQVQSRMDEGQDPILCRLSDIWSVPLLSSLPAQDQLYYTLAEKIQEILTDGRLNKQMVGGEEWDLEVLEVAAKQALEDGEGGFV